MAALITRTRLAAALTAYVATITTPFCGLFTNNITPEIDTTYGTLIEPTASWYARVAIVFGSIYDDIDGNMYATGKSLQFSYSGSDAPTTVFGYFISTAITAGSLVGLVKLTTPAVLGSALDAVIIQPALVQPPW